MVLSKLIEENQPDFLADLLRGDMVEIAYLKDGRVTTVNWPTVVAKAVSTRFKCLDKHGEYQTYTVFDCLGVSQAEFESKLFRSTVSDLMDHFGKWLYTGNIDLNGQKVWDLWTFGEAFGAPRYQNDVMKALCAKGLDNNPSLIITKYFGFNSITLKKCWEQADFGADGAHNCFIEQGTVYWGNKQMLKFVLDIIVFVGMKDSMVRAIIRNGGYIAEQVTKLSLEAARGKTSIAPPWKSKNIRKYLVNEAIVHEDDSSSEEEVEEESEGEDDDDVNVKDDVEDDDEKDDDAEDDDAEDDDAEDDEEMKDDIKTEEEEMPFTAEELLAEGTRLAQPRYCD